MVVEEGDLKLLRSQLLPANDSLAPFGVRAARCRAEPAGVHQMASAVTPRGNLSRSTVLDVFGRTRDSAAEGGDVPGSN
jgi:hypothetical protein